LPIENEEKDPAHFILSPFQHHPSTIPVVRLGVHGGGGLVEDDDAASAASAVRALFLPAADAKESAANAEKLALTRREVIATCRIK
jgi:hypothetical protein